MKRISITGLSLAELTAELENLGEAGYRSKQVFQWLYQRNVSAFSQMTNLSKNLQEKLGQRFELLQPAVEVLQSVDGTRKYRFTLTDGKQIESVWMPDVKRNTLCISSQVGCALKCAFCVTGAVGFQRNLTTDEIVAQVRHVKAVEGRPVSNIVFMGMGEPLLNVQNVIAAIKILTETEGLKIGHRKITVSTAGIVPKIAEFFEKAKVKLAVSLTGASDESRNFWMPINQTYDLKAIRSALKDLPLRKGQRITFEVVLMGGKNDTDEEALRLAAYVKGLPAKVNLIAYNENPFFPDLKNPTEERVESFRNILIQHGIHATVRANRGRDVMAACGQLAGKEVRKDS